MSAFLGEIIGTLFLVLLGNGVVANVVLNKTKGNSSGWMVITTGWAFAVAIPAFIFGSVSGAHLNPAVTIGLASIGKFAWADVPMYILAQFIGAMLGAVLVWLTYLPHWENTEDQGAILGSFATGPAIKHTVGNFLAEFIGTCVLVFGILGIVNQKMAPGLGALVIGGLVWAIGLSLGGNSGYAINPARDLGPRIIHAILPIKTKGDSDWGYAWIPVVAPIVGGVFGAILFKATFGI